MKTFKEILLETIPKDCWWEEMENLTNTPVHYVDTAAKAYAEQFIDAAVTECNKRIIPGHSVQASTMIGAGEAILKLKEQLK